MRKSHDKCSIVTLLNSAARAVYHHCAQRAPHPGCETALGQLLSRSKVGSCVVEHLRIISYLFLSVTASGGGSTVQSMHSKFVEQPSVLSVSDNTGCQWWPSRADQSWRPKSLVSLVKTSKLTLVKCRSCSQSAVTLRDVGRRIIGSFPECIVILADMPSLKAYRTSTGQASTLCRPCNAEGHVGMRPAEAKACSGPQWAMLLTVVLTIWQ